MNPNAPTSLNCPACGAPLDNAVAGAVVRCKFCGNVSLVPGTSTAAAAGSGALDEVRKLSGSGNLEAAIQRYMQAYGVDHDAAEQAVEALKSGGRIANPTMPGMRPPSELTQTIKDVQGRLAAGDKIGAIKLYREKFDCGLERAKEAVDQIEAGMPKHSISTQSADDPDQQSKTDFFQPAPAPKRRKGGGCVIAGLIVALVAAGVFLLVRNGAFAPTYIPEDPYALVAGQNGAAPAILARFFDPDPDVRFIGLVDTASGKLLWKAAKLSASSNTVAIVDGGDLVYTADGSALLAYHKSDGTPAWQTQMPDQLNYGDASMLVTGGRVITSNNDQSIQAYDAQTGSLVWSRPVLSYDRTLRLVGGLLAVIDYPDKSSTDFSLILLDPVTGALVNSFTPSCKNSDYSTGLTPDSQLLFDQADQAVYLMFNDSQGCVQRMDLTTGAVAWEANPQNDFGNSAYGIQTVETDTTIYLDSQNSLYAVDKSSGKIKTLLNDDGYNFVPLAIAGDRLLVRAERTRGSDQFEIWGVDATTGNAAWKMVTQGAAPIDPPNAMSGLVDNSDFAWTWHLTPAGLVLIKFQGQPNQMTLLTYNPEDGTSLGSKTIGLPKVIGDFYDIPVVISWQGQVGYLNIDVNLYSLDLSTGKLKSIY